MTGQVEIDRRYTNHTFTVQFTFLFFFIWIDYLAIRKFNKYVNSLEIAKVRWAKVTVSEVSKYLIIGIENIHTYRERERERKKVSLSLSLFSTSFFSFLFSFILSLNQHLILLLLLLFFLTRTFNIHSCEFTYIYIHTPFIIEMYLY